MRPIIPYGLKLEHEAHGARQRQLQFRDSASVIPILLRRTIVAKAHSLEQDQVGGIQFLLDFLIKTVLKSMQTVQSNLKKLLCENGSIRMNCLSSLVE